MFYTFLKFWLNKKHRYIQFLFLQYESGRYGQQNTKLQVTYKLGNKDPKVFQKRHPPLGDPYKCLHQVHHRFLSKLPIENAIASNMCHPKKGEAISPTLSALWNIVECSTQHFFEGIRTMQNYAKKP